MKAREGTRQLMCPRDVFANCRRVAFSKEKRKHEKTEKKRGKRIKNLCKKNNPQTFFSFFFIYSNKDENIGQAEIKEKILCLLTVRRPTHNKDSKRRWRHSVTTTDEKRGSPSQPTAARRLQQRQGKCTCTVGCKHGRPAVMPRLPCSTRQDSRHGTGLDFGASSLTNA